MGSPLALIIIYAISDSLSIHSSQKLTFLKFFTLVDNYLLTHKHTWLRAHAETRASHAKKLSSWRLLCSYKI